MDVDDAWKSACKAILGDEVGGLRDYEKYLSRYVDGQDMGKSAISGREVAVDSAHLPKNAKLISNDEVPEYWKALDSKPFDINEVKDLDSLVAAVSERAYYSGNIVLGNSREVTKSNRCVDSFFVHGSCDIFSGKYIAYSSALRWVEYMFGCNWGGESKFCISGYELYKDVRCMEMLRFYWCSDCYYSASIEACTNCMFSFNQRNKNHMVGNIKLQKDEYNKLKEKLLEDIRETLVAKKTVPSIIDIINQ